MIKPVAKLCRVGTTAAHTTFAGSWHRVVHEVGVLRGCRGVRRAGAGQQASGGSPLAICRRSLAQIGRKTRYRGFGTKEIRGKHLTPELPEMLERSERWMPERVPGTFRMGAGARVALALASCGALPLASAAAGASASLRLTSRATYTTNGVPTGSNWDGSLDRPLTP